MQVLTVAAFVLASIAFVVAAFSYLRMRQVQRSFTTLWGPGQKPSDIATVLAHQEKALAEARRELDAARAESAAAAHESRAALRHVALVRYDAFGDMGGRLSFSAALLDDHGDGLVLSSIHSRAESRTYAKSVVGGASAVELSGEERDAVEAARAASAQLRDSQTNGAQPHSAKRHGAQPNGARNPQGTTPVNDQPTTHEQDAS